MLKQVCNDEIIEILSLSPEQRDDGIIEKLKSFCHQLSYFESFSNENQEEQEILYQILKCVRVQQNKKNDHIFDIYGKPSKYFLVIEGKINIYQKLMLPNHTQVEQNNKDLPNQLKEDLIYNGQKLSLLQTKSKGDSIGMIDLMYKRNYQSTAICQSECVFLVLSYSDFQKHLVQFEYQNMMKTIQFLSQIPHFQNQSFGYLRDIAVNSNHIINLRGDVLYNENQNVDSVYIIKYGEYAVGCFIFLMLQIILIFIHKSYKRVSVFNSPIEKIIQNNIQEQGGPLFLSSPKAKKDMKVINQIQIKYEYVHTI